MIDLSKIAVSSYTGGLRDVGPFPVSQAITGLGTIPANTTVTRTVVVSLPVSQAISLIWANFSLTANSFNTFWIRVPGGPALQIGSSLGTIITSPSRTGNILTLTISYRAGGSPITVPDHTVNFGIHFYGLPF